jgi:sulfate adenylyltransferase subunit 1 (EFTu-like GTPase family)
VIVLPSDRRTRIAGITTFDGDLDIAHAGEAVTLTVEDDLDIGRGDMLVSAEDVPHVANALRAAMVWLNEQPASLGRRYRIKHTTRQQWASVRRVDHRININTLAQEPAETLAMNEIGIVELESARGLVFDPYAKNRATGSFILIDEASNATVAAGLITEALEGEASAAEELPGEVVWRLENGRLVLEVENASRSFGTENTARQATTDPDALHAVTTLLRRLSREA